MTYSIKYTGNTMDIKKFMEANGFTFVDTEYIECQLYMTFKKPYSINPYRIKICIPHRIWETEELDLEDLQIAEADITYTEESISGEYSETHRGIIITKKKK